MLDTLMVYRHGTHGKNLSILTRDEKKKHFFLFLRSHRDRVND